MERKKYPVGKLNGSKWIRQDLRVTIIAVRDAVECRFCPYCLRTIQEGIALSLDHITPRVFGGSNKINNLITACIECNSKRKEMRIPEFLRQCFDYPEDVVIEIVAFINRQRVKSVDRTVGRKLLEQRPLSYWSNAI